MQRHNIKLLFLFLIALIIALTPWIATAQVAEIKKEKYNIDKNGEDGIGYAQAVRVGKTLYISGTVGGGEMSKAVKSVYSELEKTLKHYGLTFHHVVKENVFTTDIEALKTQQELRKKFYAGDFPAASWVEVKRLYLPELTVEVELIAEIP